MIGFFLASLLGLAPAAPELLLVANKADNTVTVIDVESGASLAEVVAARPTAPWDAKYGDPTMFLDRAYASLVRTKAARSK